LLINNYMSGNELKTKIMFTTTTIQIAKKIQKIIYFVFPNYEMYSFVSFLIYILKCSKKISLLCNQFRTLFIVYKNSHKNLHFNKIEIFLEIISNIQ